jgi:hypothetical protein
VSGCAVADSQGDAAPRPADLPPPPPPLDAARRHDLARPPSDGGPDDGGQPGDGGADDGGPPVDLATSFDLYQTIGPIVYPTDRTLSPITQTVADGLRSVAVSVVESTAVFAKLGDVNTVTSDFMQCFAGNGVNLGARTDLESARTFFLAGNAAGTNPYVRVSLAAMNTYKAGDVIAGTPSPLAQEVTAVTPRQGVVLLGTYDVMVDTTAGSTQIFTFGDNLRRLTDSLLASGTIPLLTSLPARPTDAAAQTWVPRYNAVVRGVAQARQMPFIDLALALAGVPGQGVGSDGIQLNVATSGGCDLTDAGLQFGQNVRNLTTLDTLARVRDVLAGGAAPDAVAPQQMGSGTPSDPFIIDSLPYTDARDTSIGGQSLIQYYSCAPTTNEGGNEYYYQLTLTAPTTIRAMVFDRASSGVDIDVMLLSMPVASACLARNNTIIVTTLNPGTYYFSLDTYVKTTGVAQAGEYLFVLTAD